MIIGSHVQMAAPDFLLGSVEEALSYGANALMLYTGAPQNTRRRALDEMKIEEAKSCMKENNLSYDNFIVHAPYIINPANSVKPEVAELAVEFLQTEIERSAAIGAKYIVLHPGSFTTTDLETGIQTIIKQLNKIKNMPKDIVICLETMAGKGSEVGYSFEHLARIIEGVKNPEHYGVCLDTCHIHDAGYDLSDFDKVLDEFDEVIGLDRLHVIHLNDSKNIKGARKDRHANIGMGEIGFDTLLAIANNKRVENIPKILETPYIGGNAPYKYEIEMLRNGKFNKKKLEALEKAED